MQTVQQDTQNHNNKCSSSSKTATFGTFHKVSRREPCPVCHKPDWCRTFPDGKIECMRTPNDRPTKSGGWMHDPDGDQAGDWRERPYTRPIPSPEPERSSLERRQVVCGAFPRLCPVSAQHRPASWPR